MNTGKELESLIHEIERILLPNGFNIETNVKKYEEGIQIGELDLVISGPIGTGSISWLIECRDRPSEGPQPVSWIEQLMGRRDRYHFNKVTAVSTTGFSQGAISLANKENVELHTVAEVTSSDIITWWGQGSLTITEYSGLMFFVYPTLDNVIDLDTLERVKARHINPGNEKILVSTLNGETYSFQDAWSIAINKNLTLFDGLIPNSGTRKVILRTIYTNPQDRYCLVFEGKRIDILQIDFHAELRIIETQTPIYKILEVNDPINKKTIDQLVKYRFKILDHDIEFTSHKFTDSNSLGISYKCDQAISQK